MLTGQDELPPIKERAELMRKHPLFCTDFFKKKWEDFFARLKRVYQIEDWYVRCEFQARGAVHHHCLFKLKSDPGIINLTQEALQGHKALIEQKELLKKKSQWNNEDSTHNSKLENLIQKGKIAAQTVERYHDWLITTENALNQEIMDQEGNMNWDKPQDHQCTKTFTDMKTEDAKKTDYINLQCSCERHTYCKPGYCLRRRQITEKRLPNGQIQKLPAGTFEEYCRFDFPFDCRTDTKLLFEPHELKDGSVRYIAKIHSKRNDRFMNTHDRWILQMWRANCDRQLLLDHEATIRYTTKYVSKAEKTSRQLLRALEKMVRCSDETDSSTKTVNKIMNKCIGIRDMSKNEICFLIAGYDHFYSSRTVKQINLFENENGYINFKDPHQNVYGKSFIEKYMNRDPKYESMNIDTYALKVDFSQGKEKEVSNQTVKNRVCRFRPRYSSNPTNENYPKHCKYNLLRFKTFRSKDEIFTDETTDEKFVELWTEFLKENPELPIPKHREQLENAEYVLQCIEVGEDIEAPPHEVDQNYNWFKKNVKTVLTEDKIQVCRDMNVWKQKNLEYSKETLSEIQNI